MVTYHHNINIKIIVRQHKECNYICDWWKNKVLESKIHTGSQMQETATTNTIVESLQEALQIIPNKSYI